MVDPTVASVPRVKVKVGQFLRLAGLGRWEATALVQLLVHGPAAPQELARATGIPKNKVYDVLEHLARRRLVYADASNEHAHHAAHPEVVFDLLLEAARTMRRLRDEILQELVAIQGRVGEAEQPADAMPTVTDNQVAMNSMLMEDLAACRSEVMIAGHDLKWLEESRPLLDQLEHAAEDGVKVRLLSDDRDELERILVDHGALEARVPRQTPLQSPIVVAGRRSVYMGVARGPGRAHAEPTVYVRMRRPDVTADLVRLFRETWEQGEDVRPRAAA
jgi:sugar-specific transcriptional regulator TrmB